MKSYSNFIGIDIGKFEFVVAVHGQKVTKTYQNDEQGIAKFIEDHQEALEKSLCVLEPTGGYERLLLSKLCLQSCTVHRAHTKRTNHFKRSHKNAVKTDAIDARSLALYGYERSEQLEPFVSKSEQELERLDLVKRRHDLKRMLAAERNRSQSPQSKKRKFCVKEMIEVLEKSIQTVTKEINQLMREDEILNGKKKVLQTIPGFGETTVNDLLALLPELGHLNQKQIASLSGLAPIANDSGKYHGYRHTCHGRRAVKSALFMGAMAAGQSKSFLGDYYQKKVKDGKKKMVARVALMRKMIVIANARIRDFIADQENKTIPC